VRDVSLPRVFTCAAEDDVRSAVLTMTSQNVRRLPVVDSDGRLAGILSIDDVLLKAEKRPGKSGISYANVVDAAKTILIGRRKNHKHEPAELVAAAHN
jgi:CBS domain-containing protein